MVNTKINTLEFRFMLLKKGLRLKDIKEACGITYTSLSDKIEGRTAFTMPEACAIQKLASLDAQDVSRIFGMNI